MLVFSLGDEVIGQYDDSAHAFDCAYKDGDLNDFIKISIKGRLVILKLIHMINIDSARMSLLNDPFWMSGSGRTKNILINHMAVGEKINLRTIKISDKTKQSFDPS